MQVHTQTLQGSASGTRRELVGLHYGPPLGAGVRRALLQASLHADEIPPMLVAQHLRQRLAALEAAGALRHEIVLLPACNPIGLAQQAWGRHQGRFDIASGQNFNRHYPDLAAAAAARVTLGDDGAENVRRLRLALHAALAEVKADTELQALRRALLGLAIDADIVLDLHCDNQGVMHLYSTPHQAERAARLGQCLQAPLALLAEESGDFPFDEACSMLWPRLQALCPGHPVPAACFAATTEHRGEADVTHTLAAQDAEGLLRFLAQEGFIDDLDAPAPFDCSLRPLAGALPLTAPHAGVLVYHASLGAEVRAGDLLLEVVDPVSGQCTPLHSPVDGLHYAREQQRWAQAGQSVARVAGHAAVRHGKLLSA